MDKIALITGASTGIGKEFAILLASHGYSLILIARSAHLLSALQEEIKSKYQREVKTLPIDLSLPESIDIVYETFKDEMPRIDILINNAGFGILSKFSEMTAEDVRGMVELNVAALTKLTYKILPHMAAKKNGKILNLASIAAFIPGPYMAEYFATKAYVLSFSEALYEENIAEGVTVSVLCPGPTESEFFKRSGSANAAFSKPNKMSAEEVAKIGYLGLMSGKRVIVAGLKNRLMTSTIGLIPHFLSLKWLVQQIKPHSR